MAYVPSGGLIRLRQSLSGLSDSERKIAQFILDNPTEAVNMTIQDLSEKSNSSPAAAVRLWKSLGFDSYQDFKLRVASDLHLGAATKYVELSGNSSFEDTVSVVESSYVQSIQSTLRLLKEDQVKAVASAIIQAPRCLTFGVGASGVVASDFAQKLMRIGCLVQYANDFDNGAAISAQLGPGDVLIAVSHSGRTADVCEVAEIAQANGATIIAITSFGETPLARTSSLQLYTSAVEPEIRVAATSSRISALTIIDTLFIYLANQSQSKVYAALEATRTAVQWRKRR